MMAFLTPNMVDIESPLVVRSFEIPSGLLYLLSGAIGELFDVENWEPFGDADVTTTTQILMKCISIPLNETKPRNEQEK